MYKTLELFSTKIILVICVLEALVKICDLANSKIT